MEKPFSLGAKKPSPAMKVWRKGGWLRLREGVEMRALSGDEGCLLMMFRLRAGSEVPTHTHKEAQYGVVLKGRGTFTTGGGEIEVGEGDAYAVKPGEPHGFKAFEEVVVIDVFVPARRDYLKSLREPAEESP